LLVTAMTSVGFVNYAHEWWHYSYGDRYWAYATDSAAIYDGL
jgi:D-alanyl-D-alanine dipeptidase